MQNIMHDLKLHPLLFHSRGLLPMTDVAPEYILQDTIFV